MSIRQQMKFVRQLLWEGGKLYLKSDPESELCGDGDHCRFTQASLPAVVENTSCDGPFTVTVCYDLDRKTETITFGASVRNGKADAPYRDYGRGVAMRRWQAAVNDHDTRPGFCGVLSVKDMFGSADTKALRAVLQNLVESPAREALRKAAKHFIESRLTKKEFTCEKCRDTGVSEWNGKGRKRTPKTLCDCETGKRRQERPDLFEKPPLVDEP
jgi:hypothetical protein